MVLCDWHYERADPTAAYFALSGFRVATCPWRKPEVAALQVQDLARWRAQSPRPVRDRLLGMVQTVWSGVGPFLDELDGLRTNAAPSTNATSVARCYVRTFDELRALSTPAR